MFLCAAQSGPRQPPSFVGGGRAAKGPFLLGPGKNFNAKRKTRKPPPTFGQETKARPSQKVPARKGLGTIGFGKIFREKLPELFPCAWRFWHAFGLKLRLGWSGWWFSSGAILRMRPSTRGGILCPKNCTLTMAFFKIRKNAKNRAAVPSRPSDPNFGAASPPPGPFPSNQRLSAGFQFRHPQYFGCTWLREPASRKRWMIARLPPPGVGRKQRRKRPQKAGREGAHPSRNNGSCAPLNMEVHG